MQDKKLINVSQAVIGAQGVYSIEFHEDQHYTHVKRANPDGTASYFSVGGSGGGTTDYIQNLELVNNGLELSSTGIGSAFNTTLDVTPLRLGMVTSGYLSGNSPSTVYVGGSTPAQNGHVIGDWVIDLDTSNIWYLANADTNVWIQSQGGGSVGPTVTSTYENYSDSGNINYIASANTPTPVQLDGNGPFEDKRFSPTWISHDLYDTSAFKIDLTEVPIGKLVHITYDIELVPTSSNEYVHIYFEFSAFGGYKLYIQDGTMRQQSTVHHYSGTKTFFVINEDVQIDGVRLMVETGCDVQIIPNFMMIALL